MYERNNGSSRAKPETGNKTATPYFPLFVSLEKKSVTVVGGGISAYKRIRTLLKFGAGIKVIAPDISPETALLVKAGEISWLQIKFSPPLLEGSDLVIAATDIRELNKQVGEAAKRMQILVCVSDSREESSFTFPTIVQHESIVAGVMTLDSEYAAVKAIARKIYSWLGGIPGSKGNKS